MAENKSMQAPNTGTKGEKKSEWKTIKSILAASSGNLVEWFDFYIYSFFSVYFADQFFVSGNQALSLMQAAGVFFIGFLMRPIGGYVFGRAADRLGRKNSMLISILLMCAGSLLMAILPTAATAGALAPILLLVVRMIQGLAVGGEYGATATYMSEVATEGKRGFYSSFQYVTLIGGQLLASLLAVIMTHTLGTEQIEAGWWRLPFVIGAAAAVVSLWLRRGLEETTSAESRTNENSGSFREVLRHPRAFFVVLGITSVGSLVFYVFTTYMQKYLLLTNEGTAGEETFNKGSIADLMTICLLVFVFMQPAAGKLSDKIGRKNNMLIFVIGMIILPIPMLSLIGSATSPVVAGLLILVTMAFISMYTSISGIVKAEMFPAHIRGIGVGFTYAVGNSIFGGSAEYVALWFSNAGIGAWFGLYVVIIAVVGLVAVLFMRDNRKHSTIDNADSSAYQRIGN
ncbi:MAG: MFS transporter [Brevibacterium aurantiacum]|uniref:Putative proline/betaine transporter n=1 Tax=Brevibacterium aurantiacum TaxID=273384 RepID=A0A2A3ZB69_BREAU|nr:MFS transporter [Brevibacterium aurantiacum]AZL13703.1 alpha-ketoglutarate permease [Brevibacterium aurantiacum]AZT94224.1 alpha-ketoglutarate permease [Brevibacterium aurantiacum]AZT98014.1 alpha-ketoglutarate permease [Brevibacterium aurantiacum]PCC48774.1 alpha-ketoglutarate permease [Brevibacterium aurantiacum]RCS94808.1 MFS transporter [Brevibacterium aurantiacum]